MNDNIIEKGFTIIGFNEQIITRNQTLNYN